MLRYHFEESIIYWVITTAHAMERALNEEVMPLGMTYRQVEVLAWLALEGELSQAELARRMQIEAPTLAGILDRMERAEWVKRVPCAADRRKKQLKPTERAEPVWTRAMEAGLRVRMRASEGLATEQIGQIIQALQRIQKNLRQISDQPEADSLTAGNGHPE